MRPYLFAGLIAVVSTACATMPTGPNVLVLPGTGKALVQFEADDATCKQWAARQIGVTARQAAAKTTVGGVATGKAADGAASASPATSAAVGAGSGLPGGSTAGAGLGERERWSVQDRYDVAYMQCMYASGNQIPVPRESVPIAVRALDASPANDSRASIPRPPEGIPPPPPPGEARRE
jgi:hypothetical protein